jgi:hypothetical protein
MQRVRQTESFSSARQGVRPARRRAFATPLQRSRAMSRDWRSSDGCSKNRSCALRSMPEVGLSARTHNQRGALLERWRAQCGTTRSTIQQWADSRICRESTRHVYTEHSTHRFPEPCGHFGLTSPHQSTSPEGQNDRCRLDRVDIVRSRRTSNLSRVSVIVDRHEGQEPGRRQLLAVHQLRRNLERVTDRGGSAERGSMAMTSSGVVRRLLELIAALDRRVPQFQRGGEASIARDATALKARAR